MSPKPSSINLHSDTDALCAGYLGTVMDLMRRILDEEREALDRAAERMAEQIAADRLVHIFGPGGHSNLAAQELFFRAGGLMHVAAILERARCSPTAPCARWPSSARQATVEWS